MIISIAILLILGFAVNGLFKKIKLPGLLGMLILGIVLGPYGLDWLSPGLLQVSDELRKFALVVILLRAGLGISRKDLEKVGFSAVKFSMLPGLIEGFLIAVTATWLFGFTFVQGGILGFIIAAVSPAVVVPKMLHLLQQRLGTDKAIPTLILAGASVDDVFAITLFTSFLGFYSGSQVDLGRQLLGIPISIVLGVVGGILLGLLLAAIFQRFPMRDTKRVLFLISGAILLTALETALHDIVGMAALLGVMVVGFILLQKLPVISKNMSKKLNQVWVFAEVLLFVLVGARVNVGVAMNAGLVGLLIILIGLVGRSAGVLLATVGSDFNWKERLFCIVAYTPKATVQAAIGAIPLSLGVASGDLILAIAVMSILFTAPLGAIGIDRLAPRLLHQASAIAENGELTQ